MQSVGQRRLSGASLAVAACLVLAACSGSTKSPTPVPTQGPIVTPAVIAPVETPTPEPTELATPTPTPTPTAAPTETAAPTPDPTAAPSPSAAPDAASRAQACSGTAQFKNLFAEAASRLPFAVYCAVVPSDYWIQSGSWESPDGGFVETDYRNGRDFLLVLEQGNLCPTGDCEIGLKDQGRIWLGDMGADLFALSMTPNIVVAPSPTLYLALARPSRGHDYALIGMGMSKGTFIKLAAAVVKVPRT